MGESGELRPAPAWAGDSGHIGLSDAVGATDAGAAIDRLLIGERIARYGWCYDERDPDGLRDCFTSDGLFEARLMGTDAMDAVEARDAIVDFLVASWQDLADQRRHIFTNFIVDLDGDSAVAHAYLLLVASSDASMVPQTVGPYRMEVAREDDGVWRISRMSAGFDAPY
jgi:ketosteroid isomerase-like protein